MIQDLTRSSLEHPDDHQLIARWNRLHEPEDFELILLRWGPYLYHLTNVYRRQAVGLRQGQQFAWDFEAHVMATLLCALSTFTSERKLSWLTHLATYASRIGRFVGHMDDPDNPQYQAHRKLAEKLEKP